jgi:hypothetical protein
MSRGEGIDYVTKHYVPKDTTTQGNGAEPAAGYQATQIGTGEPEQIEIADVFA